MLLEGVDELANAAIHGIDHRGIDRHAQLHGLLSFRVELVPVFDLGNFLGEFDAGVDDAHLEHALVFFLSQLVPAFVEFASVLGDVLRAGVQGQVGCVVGEVEEEGFVRGVLKVPVEELVGMLRDALGEVVVIARVDGFVIECQLRVQ